MFIYSLKSSTIKLVAITFLSVALLVALIIIIPGFEPVSAQSDGAKIDYNGADSNEGRIKFLSQFGWLVNPEASEVVEVTIPSDFDAVMEKYNMVQKQQGLDLGKFKGKNMKRYTYVLADYPGYEGTVYANILVYKNKVVGGDICSADINGFMHGFDPDNKPLG